MVELCRQGDRSIGQVSRDLGLPETSVRRWLKPYEADIGEGPPGALTTAERKELKLLRRQVKRLREDRDILRRATVFFAKGSE